MKSLLLLLLLSAVPFQVFGQKSEQDAYDSATLLFNNEEYELAAGEYQSLLKTATAEDVRAKCGFKAAECFFQLAQYDRALPLFQDYLAKNPSHGQRPEGLFRKSECHFFLKDYGAAVASYNGFIRDNPDHALVPRAMFSVGSACVELGSFPKAREAFEKLIAKYPDSENAADARFNLAWVYLKEQDFSKAADAFLLFHEKHPKASQAAEALLRAADCRYRSGKHQESLSLYNRVLSEGEGAYKNDSLRGIAWSYYKMEQYEKAAGAFLGLAKQSDEVDARAQAFFQAVQSFHCAKQPSEGLRTADEMLAACPGHALLPDTLYWKGIFLRELGKKEEALAVLKACLEKKLSKVSAVEAKHELAGLYIALKQYPEAVKLLEDASREATGVALSQIRYDLARSLHLSGRTEQAIKISQDLLKETGADEQTKTLSRFNLGEYLFSQKKYEEAVGHYQAVLKSGSKDASTTEDARYRLGWCFKFLDKPKQAIEVFSEVDLDNPQSKYGQEAKLLLAELFEKTGEPDKAKAQYSALIERRNAFSGDACLALAQMNFQEKRYDKVIDLAQQFLRLFPGHSQELNAQFLLAEASFESGKKDTALFAYDRIISSTDSSLRASALYGKAWLLYQDARLDEALAPLELLLKQYPESSFTKSAVQLQGRIYSSQGKPEKAKEVLLQRISKLPEAEREQVLFVLAGVLTEMKDYEGALKTYDEIAAKYPDSPNSGRGIYEKGWVLMQMGKADKASGMFELYRKTNPKGPLVADVEFAMGELDYTAKRHKEALAHYEASRADPRYLDKSLYKGAWCRFSLGEFGASADLFAELAKSCPGSPLLRESLYNEGLCRLKNSQFQEASVLFEAFLKKGDAKDSLAKEAVFNLAKVYDKLDKPESAQKRYEEYLKTWPEGELASDAHVCLGNILLEAGRYRQAGEHYGVVAGSNHHLVLEALFGLGESHFHLDEYPDAIKSYTETLRYQGGDQWKAASLFRIAQCHRALKNPDKAEKYLKRVKAEFPNSEYAKKAEEELGKK